MFSSTILVSALTALAAASPVSHYNKPRTFSSGTQQLATFDDLASLPAVSQLSQVGTYKGLTYGEFDVLQAGVASVRTGVSPQSGQNTAVHAIVNDVTEGGGTFFAAASPSTKSFDLQNLYFGCVLTTVEGVASAPLSCTVSFTAFKKGSSTPYTSIDQSFSPTNAVLSKMTQVNFDALEFSGLGRVDVAVVAGDGPSVGTALLLDNISYKTYSS